MKVTPSRLFSLPDQSSGACFNKAENTDIIQTSRYPRMINNRLHFRPRWNRQDITEVSGSTHPEENHSDL